MNRMLAEEIMGYCHKKSCNKIIILLENEWQVKDCINYLDEIKCEKTIIALAPFAIYELDKQKIPYKSIGEYYDLVEFLKFGNDNFQKCEDLCAIIDKKIQETCPIISEKKITPALFSFYNLKILYDTVMLRIFQLSSLIDFEKPDAVFIYETETFGLQFPNLNFDNRESIFSKLLDISGWNMNIISLQCAKPPENNLIQYTTRKDSIFKIKVVNWLQNHPKLYNLALSIRDNNFSGLSKFLFSRKNPVLIFAGGYNWDECMEEFYQAKIGPVFRIHDNMKNWVPTSNNKSVSNAWHELSIDNEFCEFFMLYGINFFPIVESRLKYLVEKYTPACLNSYEEVSEILTKRNIKAFLISTISTCTAHSAAKAAHDANIPVVTWQHGGYGFRSHRIIDYLDLMNSDFHFVFGNAVENQHKESARRFDTQLISIGSASLDALHLKKASANMKQKFNFDSNKKTMMYVTTHFHQNKFYTSHKAVSSDSLLDGSIDNSIQKVQQTLIEILGKQNNYNLIIKLHQGSDPSDPVISYINEKCVFDNYKIIIDEFSATDLIPIADIIVVDAITTVILQMLTTSKPVFVYTGLVKMDDIAEELLKRRAHSYFNLDEFTTVLDTLLNTDNLDVHVDLNNRDFLRMYGTHIDDGKSAERAASTLKSIIENNNQN